MAREYLQLTRAHTAPLEMVPAIIAGALVSGGLYTQETAIAGLFGLLYHLAGYGHNSVADWKNGYDKNDPYKDHHPLNTGELSLKQAERFVRILLAAFILVGVLIAMSNFDAIMYLVMGAVAGVLYNLYGKESMFDTLTIAIAHTTPFAVSYLGFGGDVHRMEFLFGTLFIYFWVVFQISVSGEVLGIESDEENVLRLLGARVKGETEVYEEPVVGVRQSAGGYGGSVLETDWQVKAYTVLVMSVPYIMILLVASQFAPFWPLFIGVVIYGSSCIVGYEIVKDGAYNRGERMRMISVKEALTLFTFIFLLSSSVSSDAVFILLTVSFLWVMLMNKWLWGTLISPRV